MDLAVLVIGFNRPDLMEQVLQSVKAAGVLRVYISTDGPRVGRPDDAGACAEVAALVGSCEWAPRVKVRSNDENLGCKRAVVEAIDWFFLNEKQGVVLEDDCLPSADFFPFMRDLLERYARDEKVSMISGYNQLGGVPLIRSDYVFSRDAIIWGWGTWRRSWQHRDPEMISWGDPGSRDRARAHLGRARWKAAAPSFEAVANGKIDTWDYQWLFVRASRCTLAIAPKKNLVRNLGFGDPRGTHTIGSSRLGEVESRPLRVTRHPRRVNGSDLFDTLIIAEAALRRLAYVIKSRIVSRRPT